MNYAIHHSLDSMIPSQQKNNKTARNVLVQAYAKLPLNNLFSFQIWGSPLLTIKGKQNTKEFLVRIFHYFSFYTLTFLVQLTRIKGETASSVRKQ